MKVVVTTRELRYPRGANGKTYLRGAIIDAPDSDARNIRTLIKIGRVEPAANLPAKPLREAASVVDPTAATDETPMQRRYRTRALTAED